MDGAWRLQRLNYAIDSEPPCMSMRKNEQWNYFILIVVQMFLFLGGSRYTLILQGSTCNNYSITPNTVTTLIIYMFSSIILSFVKMPTNHLNNVQVSDSNKLKIITEVIFDLTKPIFIKVEFDWLVENSVNVLLELLVYNTGTQNSYK